MCFRKPVVVKRILLVFEILVIQVHMDFGKYLQNLEFNLFNIQWCHLKLLLVEITFAQRGE